MLAVHVILASGIIGGFVAIGVFILLVDRLHWLSIDFHGKTLRTIEPAGLVLGLIITISVTILLLLAAWRLLERRPICDLFHLPDGPAHHLNSLIVGLAIGFGEVALVCLLLTATGSVYMEPGWQVVPGKTWAIALGWLIASCILAPLSEEILFRGYWFHNLLRGWGLVPAIIVPALLFGLIHLLNPNASPPGAFNIALSGSLFAIAMVWRRSLWLPIGWHAGWNFCQFFVVGLPNSGFSTSGLGVTGTTLLTTRLKGPEWWTGGAFGLEASPANTLVLVSLLALAGVLWKKSKMAVGNAP